MLTRCSKDGSKLAAQIWQLEAQLASLAASPATEPTPPREASSPAAWVPTPCAFSPATTETESNYESPRGTPQLQALRTPVHGATAHPDDGMMPLAARLAARAQVATLAANCTPPPPSPPPAADKVERPKRTGAGTRTTSDAQLAMRSFDYNERERQIVVRVVLEGTLVPPVFPAVDCFLGRPRRSSAGIRTTSDARLAMSSNEYNQSER